MGLFNKKKHKHSSSFNAEQTQRTLHSNLAFTATEQYKLLRANLDFTVPEGTKCPIIGITSSMRGEGKSTTAVNLAYVFAETGSRVLLIDGDLRIPTIAKKMGIPNSPGLTDVLMGKDSYTMESFKSSMLDSWYIMPSGDIPPNPSELLGSKRMESALQSLREEFDYIIVDLPPVNIVSDALSIAKYITGLVVVVREEHTEKKELERCFRQLTLSNVKVLGCVMNGAKGSGGGYKKYRRYRYYKYYKYSRYYDYKYDYRYEYKDHSKDNLKEDDKK